jgi:hypothetical protein
MCIYSGLTSDNALDVSKSEVFLAFLGMSCVRIISWAETEFMDVNFSVVRKYHSPERIVFAYQAEKEKQMQFLMFNQLFQRSAIGGEHRCTTRPIKFVGLLHPGAEHPRENGSG